MGDNREFKSETFLLPPRKGQGYNFTLTNLAPGTYASINDLVSIELTPIDFQLWNAWYSQNTAPTSEVVIQQPVSYESNWVALWWKSLGDFKPLTEQVLVNNWSNGWKISTQDLESMQKEGYHLKFIFLPQWLEYFGLAVGSGTLTLLAFKSLYRRRSKV